jgi:hypothetical protein
VAAHVLKESFGNSVARRCNPNGKRRRIRSVKAALAVFRLVDISNRAIAATGSHLDVFALMRKAAKDFRLYFPGLPWCLRIERGEINGRLHNHFLLTGLPDNAVSVPTCFAMMRTWTNKLRGGHAQIRIFDPRLSGVDYVAKCLGYQLGGADVYESAKFGVDGRELMYSRAVSDEANHFRRRADR